ncbi:hypothetical protein NIES37_51250 [Tolypothrix tenuis PCC 7101]|uniref:Endonuclease GajA/Old nuclease/RecF-like AAA domain-containing protein n=1 Tax=Tolypothrix tenuis PCC 7101 TaxID=231146 RepID=A0A1Z4N5Z5_9CYAN|nr:AAA family ATPase [Aulosira sp. FACHB-113]BAZ01127.1 hypothetical protein NIES37_51250 [Tolypothrix tenuis PCC 7101]BAZ74951.1 hypothetical protein NIES50_35310 [Aulosira laxa NIES-50]
MITEIELQNVRIFEGSGWKFPLLPLSVICGTNSAGKSTILKTILLLRQSQSVRESYGVIEGKLRLVGNQVDLGSYSSFVSNNETRNDVGIALTIKDEMPIDYYQRLLKINAKDIDGNSLEESKEIDYQLKSHFTFGIVNRRRKKSKISTLQVIENNDVSASFTPQAILKKACFEIIVQEENLLSWYVEYVNKESDNPSYEIIIPQKFFKDTIGAQRLHPKRRNKSNVIFETAHPGILPSTMIAKERQQKKEGESNIEEKSRWLFVSMPPIIREAIYDLNKALSDIHYIGPLRSSPQRYYLSYLESASNIDPTGASLPYILREKEIYKSSVWNVAPCQKSPAKKEPLSKALNSWLYYLRVGEKPPKNIEDTEIEIHTTGDLVVELKIRSATSGKSYSLADSGFGYSQVLPIVVKGLLADRGSVLIIEQPELHLNPALQVRLADFFIAMIIAGKQILIETHSEHIVNAIRVLTAEDESGELAGKCSISFIDTQSEQPIVHELSIKSDGTIPDLPRHFFGEAISLSGRLLRAQKRFRTKVDI